MIRLRSPKRALAALAAALVLAAAPEAWALLGDVDGSGRVDGLDLILLSRSLGTVRGQARFADAGDLDGDGRITDRDIAIVKANFARTGRDQNLWVADTGNGRLVKVNVSTGRTLTTVPVADARLVAIDTASGDAWAAAAGNTLVHVTATGRVLARVTGFGDIRDLAVDSARGIVYVADAGLQRVFRVPRSVADGTDAPSTASVGGSSLTSIRSSSSVRSLAVDPPREALWVLERESQLHRVSTRAPGDYSLSSSPVFHTPNGSVRARGRIAVDGRDGSLVVSDQDVFISRVTNSITLPRRVSRISAGNSSELFASGRGIGIFDTPGDVAVNAFDSSVWVANEAPAGAWVVKVDASGKEVVRVGGFKGPLALSVDPFTGALWVADTGASRVHKLTPTGVRQFDLAGFSRPGDLAVLPGDSIKGAPFVGALAVPTVVAIGEPVSFSGVAASLTSSLTRFEWDFDGDGTFEYSSPSTASVTRAFSREGVYNAVLRVADADQLSGIDYSTIVRVGSLRATASASPLRGRAPLAVDFTVHLFSPISGRAESVQWDFDGDGSFESFQESDRTSVTVRNTFSKAGTYRAIVKVTDEIGSTVESAVTVEVTPARPVLSFFGSASSGPAPLEVRYSASGNVADGSLAAFRFDFDGDGTTDLVKPPDGTTNGTTALFVYRAAGTYLPRLEVTDSKGLTETSGLTVTVSGDATVRPRAPAILASATPREGPAPLGVTLGATLIGGDSPPARFDWVFGDGPLEERSLLTDTADGGLTNFSASGTWGTTGSPAVSGLAFTDSPSGNYRNNTDSSLTSREITVAGATTAVLSYFERYDTESCCDRGRVEVSRDGGPFVELTGSRISGIQNTFARRTVGIPNLEGIGLLRLRFRFTSDSSTVKDGWVIDDISLTAEVAASNFTSTTTVAASHTYTSPGLYRAILVETGELGEVASGSITVRVLPQGTPRAAAQVRPVAGVLPLVATLDGSGSTDADGPLSRFQWSLYGAAIADDVETVRDGFTVAAGGWQRSSEASAPGGSTAWNDSPGAAASAGTEAILMSKPFDWPVRGSGEIAFTHKFDIPDFDDRGTLELSSDGGTTWQEVTSFSGSNQPFRRTRFDAQSSFAISQATGKRNLRARWRLRADGDATIGDGWVVDDLLIRGEGAPPQVDVEAGGAAVTQAVYRIEGSHSTRLVVTDSSGLTATTTVPVTILAPVVSPTTPTVSLSIFPSEATVGAPVTIGAFGADFDGSVVRHELDIDDDGVYEFASRFSFSRTFRFTSPGSKRVRARVTDNGGNTTEKTGTVLVRGPAPAVSFRVEPLRGFVPLTPTYTVEASSPSGAVATNVELDFDGNGSFDFSATSAPLTTRFGFNFSTSSSPRARVTMADGGQSLVRADGFVARAANRVLSQPRVTPSSGPVPLTVEFDAGPARTDAGQPIATYRWDFENDGVFDFVSTTTAATRHTYPSGGQFLPRLEVRLADGDSDTALAPPVFAGRPPQSIPRASPVTGTAPLRVIFTCDGGLEGDTIDKYEWDFDGDGVFDQNSRISRNFAFTFERPGTYDARLRVTSQAGLANTRAVRVRVLSPGDAPLEVLLAADQEAGLTPLPVTFEAALGDGVSLARRFEWDFDGDGALDLVTTSAGGARFVFGRPGFYNATVTVTDERGRKGRAVLPIRARSATQPTATLNVSPASGTAPLAPSMSASVQTRSNSPLVRYEWDFDGDGKFDQLTTANFTTGNYPVPGTFLARVRVTDAAGEVEVAQAKVTVGFGISASHTPAGLDPELGGAVAIRSVLSAAARITLRIQDRAGLTLRHLVRDAQRPAGIHVDNWDGRADSGTPVSLGSYTYAIDYVAGTASGTYDPSGEVFESQTSVTPEYDDAFDPAAGKTLAVRFSIFRPSECTVYVVEFPGVAVRRVKTILLREPLLPGAYVIPWDGTDDSGNLVRTDVDYIMPLFVWDAPKNAIVISGRPVVSDLSAFPLPFDLSVNPYRAPGRDRLEVELTLSKPAELDVGIFDELNKAVRTLRLSGLDKGRQTFSWDGRDSNGARVDAGLYRIRILATDARGNRSVPVFLTVQVVY
ncbi:MAG: hypothetical protein HY816_23455 [Candidatus Wallbacteria bacterium]|nr:hypothetical protein [Candidatus Wallbacteria bacterium]